MKNIDIDDEFREIERVRERMRVKIKIISKK